MAITASKNIIFAALSMITLLILEGSGYCWSDSYGDPSVLLSIILIPLSVALLIKAFKIHHFIIVFIISVTLTYILMSLNFLFLKWLRVDYLAKIGRAHV